MREGTQVSREPDFSIAFIITTSIMWFSCLKFFNLRKQRQVGRPSPQDNFGPDSKPATSWQTKIGEKCPRLEGSGESRQAM